MPNSWKEFKRHLKSLIDGEPLSNYKVIQRAGLSRDAYYKLFSPDRENSAMRKSTVYSLAATLKQSVEYVNGIPQFSDFIFEFPISLAQSALNIAVAEAGGVKELAEKVKLPVGQLNILLSTNDTSTEGTVSRSFLVKVGSLIGRVLVVDSSGVPTYLSETDSNDYLLKYEDLETVNKKLAPIQELSTIVEIDDLETIPDKGLQELLKSNNVNKYTISAKEQMELSLICRLRKSQSSMENWISILFALRTLGTNND